MEVAGQVVDLAGRGAGAALAPLPPRQLRLKQPGRNLNGMAAKIGSKFGSSARRL